MGRYQILGLFAMLSILAGLTTFYFLYFPATTKANVADAWEFQTPLDLMNSSEAGYQIFVFTFNDEQKKIIRESKLSYEEGSFYHFNKTSFV